MDGLIKEGQWWWAFLVPLATGLLALLGSWLGTKWGKTTEHQQWLRNQKIEVYTNLLRQIHASTLSLEAYKQGTQVGEPPNLQDITDTTNARLAIVAPYKIRHLALWQLDAMLKASAAVDDATYEKERQSFESLVGELQAAIRRDLGLHERDAWGVRLMIWLSRRVIAPVADPFHKRYHAKHGYAWSERKSHTPLR